MSVKSTEKLLIIPNKLILLLLVLLLVLLYLFIMSLPPRKRAKTTEEKEQRRVERILRNRRAAHASREKKRKYVTYLQDYISILEQNFGLVSSSFDLSSIPLKDTSNIKRLIEALNCKNEKEKDGDCEGDVDCDESGLGGDSGTDLGEIGSLINGGDNNRNGSETNSGQFTDKNKLGGGNSNNLKSNFTGDDSKIFVLNSFSNLKIKQEFSDFDFSSNFSSNFKYSREFDKDLKYENHHSQSDISVENSDSSAVSIKMENVHTPVNTPPSEGIDTDSSHYYNKDSIGLIDDSSIYSVPNNDLNNLTNSNLIDSNNLPTNSNLDLYLSPISINSPEYSPIDLTLGKLDGVEQNSARILV